MRKIGGRFILSKYDLISTAICTFVCVVSLGLLVIGGRQESSDNQPLGILLDVSGDVQLKARHFDSWFSPEVNAPIFDRSSLYTGQRGFAQLQLGKVSIKVDSSTFVQFTAPQQESDLAMDFGRLVLSGKTSDGFTIRVGRRKYDISELKGEVEIKVEQHSHHVHFKKISGHAKFSPRQAQGAKATLDLPILNDYHSEPDPLDGRDFVYIASSASPPFARRPVLNLREKEKLILKARYFRDSISIESRDGKFAFNRPGAYEIQIFDRNGQRHFSSFNWVVNSNDFLLESPFTDNRHETINPMDFPPLLRSRNYKSSGTFRVVYSFISNDEESLNSSFIQKTTDIPKRPGLYLATLKSNQASLQNIPSKSSRAHFKVTLPEGKIVLDPTPNLHLPTIRKPFTYHVYFGSRRRILNGKQKSVAVPKTCLPTCTITLAYGLDREKNAISDFQRLQVSIPSLPQRMVSAYEINENFPEKSETPPEPTTQPHEYHHWSTWVFQIGLGASAVQAQETVDAGTATGRGLGGPTFNLSAEKLNPEGLDYELNILRIGGKASVAESGNFKKDDVGWTSMRLTSGGHWGLGATSFRYGIQIDEQPLLINPGGMADMKKVTMGSITLGLERRFELRNFEFQWKQQISTPIFSNSKFSQTAIGTGFGIRSDISLSRCLSSHWALGTSVIFSYAENAVITETRLVDPKVSFLHTSFLVNAAYGACRFD